MTLWLDAQLPPQLAGRIAGGDQCRVGEGVGGSRTVPKANQSDVANMIVKDLTPLLLELA